MAAGSAARPAGPTWRVRVRHAMRPWRRATRTARVLVVIGALMTLFFAALAIFAEQIAPYGAAQYCLDGWDAATERCTSGAEQIPRLAAPSPEHPFGTTSARFDVLSRIIHGAQAAFTVVALSTVIALFVGVPLGLLSGYFGGRFDRIAVIVMDAIYAFPSLLLAIIVAFVLQDRFAEWGIDAQYLPAALSVGIVYIPQYFRVIRNHTQSVKTEPFVEAARSMGARPRTIVWRYVFSNVVQSIPVLFTLNAADSVLTLAGLGFLGFGVDYPAAEWGLDVSRGISDTVGGYWWTAFWPGIAIAALVTGLTLVGEGLNDVINPLLRSRGFKGRSRGAGSAAGDQAGAAPGGMAGPAGTHGEPSGGSDPPGGGPPGRGPDPGQGGS